MPARSKRTLLSRKQQVIFDRFDEAAKAWGWIEDQGVGQEIADAKREYDLARTGLIIMIANLNRKIKAYAKSDHS